MLHRKNKTQKVAKASYDVFRQSDRYQAQQRQKEEMQEKLFQ